jgi:hypothetical protein
VTELVAWIGLEAVVVSFGRLQHNFDRITCCGAALS